MPYHRNYTPAQKKEIYQHYLECGKIAETAKAFGTTIITVTAVVKSFGKTPHQICKERLAKRNQEIWLKLANRESCEAVAKEYGLAEPSIYSVTNIARTKLVRSTVQPQTLEIIDALQNTSLTMGQIAEHFGVRQQRVNSINRKYQVRKRLEISEFETERDIDHD